MKGIFWLSILHKYYFLVTTSVWGNPTSTRRVARHDANLLLFLSVHHSNLLIGHSNPTCRRNKTYHVLYYIPRSSLSRTLVRVVFQCHIIPLEASAECFTTSLGHFDRRSLSVRTPAHVSSNPNFERKPMLLAPTHKILLRTRPRFVLPMLHHLAKVRACLCLLERFVFRLSSEGTSNYEAMALLPLASRLQSVHGCEMKEFIYRTRLFLLLSFPFFF